MYMSEYKYIHLSAGDIDVYIDRDLDILGLIAFYDRGKVKASLEVLGCGIAGYVKIPFIVCAGYKPVPLKNAICGLLRISKVSVLDGNEFNLLRCNLWFDPVLCV